MDQNTEKPAQPNEFQEAQAIVDQQVKDYLGESPAPEPNPVEKLAAEKKSKAEEPAKETTPAKEEPTTPAAPVLNPKELEENISQKVTANIVRELTGKTEQQMVEQSPWAKEKRNPKSYEEIVEWTKSQVMQDLQKQVAAYQQQQEEVKKMEEEKVASQKQYEQQMEKEYNTMWDNQIKSLQDKNPTLKSKEGLRNFWEQLKTHNEALDAQGLPVTANLAEFYALHYQPFTVQPAGADAPITGANANTPAMSQGEDYDYHSIHSAKSMWDLLPKR